MSKILFLKNYIQRNSQIAGDSERASPVAQLVNNSPAIWGAWVQPLGWKYPLEKETATHSSILVWRIPRTV